MPYDLVSAFEAVTASLANYDATKGVVRVRDYTDRNREVREMDPTPEDLPCVEVVPIAYDPGWHENRQQKNLFSVGITIWTRTWDFRINMELVKNVREALWSAKPDGNPLTYIEIATCFMPVTFANLRWDNVRLGEKKNPAIRCNGILVMQFTDDPLDPE